MEQITEKEMTREAFIRVWLGSKREWSEENKDRMREDLDAVINFHALRSVSETKGCDTVLTWLYGQRTELKRALNVDFHDDIMREQNIEKQRQVTEAIFRIEHFSPVPVSEVGQMEDKNSKVELSYQDDGKTLKIFIEKRAPKALEKEGGQNG